MSRHDQGKAILESEAVLKRLDAECREMAERLYQLAQWVGAQPYINGEFDAGMLSAAQNILEGFVTPRHCKVDDRRRTQERLLKAVAEIPR